MSYFYRVEFDTPERYRMDCPAGFAEACLRAAGVLGTRLHHDCEREAVGRALRSAAHPLGNTPEWAEWRAAMLYVLGRHRPRVDFVRQPGDLPLPPPPPRPRDVPRPAPRAEDWYVISADREPRTGERPNPPPVLVPERFARAMSNAAGNPFFAGRGPVGSGEQHDLIWQALTATRGPLSRPEWAEARAGVERLLRAGCRLWLSER